MIVKLFICSFIIFCNVFSFESKASLATFPDTSRKIGYLYEGTVTPTANDTSKDIAVLQSMNELFQKTFFTSDLVLFDIDETIICASKDTKKEKLIESIVAKLINFLKSKNIYVMALTNCPYSSEDKRFKTLDSFGILFSKVPDVKNIAKNGIIYARKDQYEVGLKKSNALNSYLTQTGLVHKFSRIILIDNFVKNLSDVESWARKNKKDFKGYEYVYFDSDKSILNCSVVEKSEE